jgi:hypothetical protein
MARGAPRPIMAACPSPHAASPGAAFGAFGGALIGRAILIWILDVSRTWEVAALVVFGLAGAVIGAASAREEPATRAGSSS